MEKSLKLNDIANETLAIFKKFDMQMREKIPERVINYLKILAQNSKKDVKIDESKSLANQKISEGAKDLISYVYYSYIANEEEKKEILKKWDKNEIEYIKQLQSKYNYDQLFKTNRTNYIVQNGEISTEIAEYKNNVFTKIRNFMNRLFGKKVRK